MRRYLPILRALYSGIGQVSGQDIVVDSSKLPMHAGLLRQIPLDVRVVHLVRDSRGVVFSWRKQVERDRASASTGPRFLERYGTVSASGRYLLYNALTGRLGRTGTPLLELRYEDLVTAPEASLRRVATFAGAMPSVEDLAFVRPAGLDLRPNHTVDGNPMRFSVGTVALVPDQEWRTRMPRADRVTVSALTFPLLRRYGYVDGRPAAGVAGSVGASR
jgi:hypothetical protein